MASDEVLARLSDMASTDIDEFFTEVDVQDGVDEIGNPKLEKKLRFDYTKAKKRGKTHLIKKIKVDKNGDIEFELHNSADALDKLAKFHGLYKERIDIHARIGDTEEERLRFIAVFGGFAQLAGASPAGTGWGEGIAGAFRNSGIEGPVDSGSAPALPEPTTAEGGDGEEPADPDLHAAEVGEE